MILINITSYNSIKNAAMSAPRPGQYAPRPGQYAPRPEHSTSLGSNPMRSHFCWFTPSK